jgi:catechol 2,3-dioxygenase-like lactoylglutathione lyase family enzyme
VVALLAAGPLFAQTAPESCRAPGSGLKIDHVVIAVSDLEDSAADFRSLGFTIKPGRLHPNGLLNSHVKFVDGTSLELMSVAGEPTDPVAAAYADFLQAGDGGAFAAIEADPDRVIRVASELNLPAQLTRSGPFTWVTVDDSQYGTGGQRSPVFFVSYLARSADADSLLVHDAGVVGIGSVRLDATDALADMLGRLGARHCPTDSEGEADASVVVGLENARLVLLTKGAMRHRRKAVRDVTLLGAPSTLVSQPVLLDERLTNGVRLILAAGK